MYKKIFTFITAILLAISAYAQFDSTLHQRDSMLRSRLTPCGLNDAYLSSMQVTSPPSGHPQALTFPTLFPAGTYEVCNHFTLYYEDRLLGTLDGYDAPGILGAQRRDNLCNVITYIESVFDFSKVPSGGIRLHIDRSGAYSGSGSKGLPFYAIPATPAHPTLDGFVAEYIRTGIPPAAAGTGFHGEIGIDFAPLSGIPINSDYTVSSGCALDLFTIELHQMEHVLGFFSFISGSGTPYVSAPYTTTGPFTSLDHALSTTPIPVSATAPFTAIAPLVTSTFTFSPATSYSKTMWLNGNNPPYNDAVDERYLPAIHIFDNNTTFGAFNHISPGEQDDYTMGHDFGEGVFRRKFTKGEIRTFISSLGFSYNPAYPAALATNHRPYSTKMGSDAYNHVFQFTESLEILPADYTMVNDIGTSLTIALNADPDLKDDDADHLSIFPGSLVNFRGCGNGSNNHNQLTVNSTGDSIIYTPRNNFYGRCQFGFNLFDGKEKGAFVIYTIEVNRGTRVAIPPGGNIVLNPSFEEGSEVKQLGSVASEAINNSESADAGIRSGRLSSGANLADSHPYDVFQLQHIKSSADACAGTTSGNAFGSIYATFPYTPFTGATYPLPPGSAGERYQGICSSTSLFYLGKDMENCKRYELEYDIQYIFTSTLMVVCPMFTYPIDFGFTDDAHLGGFTPGTPGSAWDVMTPVYSPSTGYGYVLPVLTPKVWTKRKITFTYCSTIPTNILYLNLEACSRGSSSHIIDNVSLRELDDVTEPLTVSIEKKAVVECQDKLVATAGMTYGCAAGPGGFTFSWTQTGVSGVIATTPEIYIAPLTTTTYTVTIADGCGHTASKSITVPPTVCPCAPSNVFHSPSITVYDASNPVPPFVGPGNYFISSDVTLTNNTTFLGANVQVAEGIRVTVGNSALLTLDSSHFFTCPESNKMWKGFTLSSGTTTSARIATMNSTLIEDADTAIQAKDLCTPASGDVISIVSTTFNRNNVGLLLHNYSPSSPSLLPITIHSSVFTAREFTAATVSGYPNSWPRADDLRATTSVTDSRPSFVLSKAPFARALCKNPLLYSFCGIMADTIGRTSGGTYQSALVIGKGATYSDYNMFDNMQMGVYTLNCNTKFLHNYFTNISKRINTSSTLKPGEGQGIRAKCSAGTNFRTELVSASYNLGNRFHDCFTGVYTERSATVNISNVFVTSSNTLGDPVAGAQDASEKTTGYGIMVYSDANIISNYLGINKVYNINTGIHLYLNNPKAGASSVVEQNLLQSENDSISATFTGRQFMMQAIEVYSNGPGSGGTSNLSVYKNRGKKVLNGVFMTGLTVTKCMVNQNRMTLWDTVTPYTVKQFGIVANDTRSTQIVADTVDLPNLSSERIRGYSAAWNANIRFCNNVTTNAGTGFEFATSSPQIGTRWVWNIINYGYKGMVLGSDIGNQGFMTDYGVWPTRTFYGGTKNVWNGVWSATSSKYQTFAINYVNTLNSKLFVNSTSAELPTVNSVFPPSTFPYKYNYSGGTGSILLRTAQYNASCDGLYVPTSSGKGGTFPPTGGPKTLMMQVIADSLGYDSTYNKKQWMAQLTSYELGRIEPDLADSSAIFNTFMTNAAAARFGWIADVQEALDNEDTITAAALLSAVPWATGRTVVDSDVVITDYADADNIIDNYAEYYRLYLKYLKEDMSGSDSTDVFTLAQRCPITDGVAVLRARSLYQRLSGASIHYNDDSCEYGVSSIYRLAGEEQRNAMQQSSIYRLAGEEQRNVMQQYSIFPNPNDGSFSILQNILEDKTVSVKVYNALGAEIYQTRATFKNGTIRLDLGQRAPGLYLVCIGDDKERNTCLRFIVR